MKKYYPITALLFFLSGCAYQAPDYLQVIAAPELNQLMQNQDIFLVDVHTPEQRHIKGTDVFIPYNNVEQHLDKLPKDKNTPIYLYCEGGPMGNAAAKTLHALGYTHLSNLDGGTKAWKQAGFGLE
ncbi:MULTISPECIES: rhodanese-like domain-containing protein [Methylomonas]|uniref:Sulfurtransferase n=1 Tax=Methylomonas denitrificans TaxID=1538553 RepID=A0A140E6T5_9GAMM|nr:MULTISPECIES: rhodanese-like domain-containing protein [Methylomonas]AMK79109.1 sulfurtransferase [Methylomonas denitrificans]OAH99614.1 sulfurtransferase [Methylomonas methanica]